MSAHHFNHVNGTSLNYFRDVLQWPEKTCHKCNTAMIPVWVRYYNKGPINYEWECIECNKIIKDPRFRKKRKS